MKRPHDTLTEDEMRRIEAAFAEVSPRVLPSDWTRGDDYVNAAWYRSRDGLRVCAEVEAHEAALWLHVSVSRGDRDPSYFDLKRVKDLFIGRDRKAIQVFPPASEHYSYHPHCLHLWSPLTRDPLPDLRNAEGGL